MRIASVVALAFGVVVGDLAHAGLVCVDFAGTVEELSGQIHQDAVPPIPISPAEAEAALGGSIHVGTPFSGFFMYDDSAIASSSGAESAGVPGFPTQAWAFYSFVNGITAHVEVGSFVRDGEVGAGSGASIDVSDNELYLDGAHPSSIFVRAGLGIPPAPEGAIALTLLQFYAAGESSGSPIHGTSLLSIPWTLESFPQPSAAFFFQNGDLQVRVGGSVNHLVPEPAGTRLVALAAFAMVAAFRGFSSHRARCARGG